MAQSKGKSKLAARRRNTQEFNQEAIQILLDGHSAASVADRLGLSSSSF